MQKTKEGMSKNKMTVEEKDHREMLLNIVHICPKASECVEDCECKEPHKLKDCQRGVDDKAHEEDCKVYCVPVRKGGV